MTDMTHFYDYHNDCVCRKMVFRPWGKSLKPTLTQNSIYIARGSN